MERDESEEGSSEVMKNYCMYLPNTGRCMLRKNTVFRALTVHSMYIDRRPLTFLAVTERHGPPRTTGLTLSTSDNLSDLSSTPGELDVSLPASSKGQSHCHGSTTPSTKHPKKSRRLLYPRRERIDFTRLLSSGCHVLRYFGCGSDLSLCL